MTSLPTNNTPAPGELQGFILTPAKTLTPNGVMRHETILKVLLALLHHRGEQAAMSVMEITASCSQVWQNRIVKVKYGKRMSHLDLVQDTVDKITNK